MCNVCVSSLLVAAVIATTPFGSPGQSRPRRVTTPRPEAVRSTVPAPHSAIPTPGDPDVIQLDGELVEVPVVVSDRTGHYVPWLQKGDFRVFEDGQPQEITHFLPERVPFHVAIVMDTSASTRDSLVDIQDAAIGLVEQLGPEDQAVVVAFAEQAIVKRTQGFTNVKHLLVQAVRDTRASGRTRLYDSVYATVSRMFDGVDGRKAMVILSDGQDTASSLVSYDEAVNVCHETDIVVYGVRYPDVTDYGPGIVTIHHPPGYSDPVVTDPGHVTLRRDPVGRAPAAARPGTSSRGRFPLPRARQPIPLPRTPLQRWLSPSAQRGGMLRMRPSDYDPFMEEVAKNSGGVVFYADAVSDMYALCQRIAEELRHVYTLGYQPRNAMRNGGYRRIRVGVPARPDATVRHRLGYAP